MQDTLVMLAERGHETEWLLNLDMCEFNSLTESSERIAARQRLTEISDGRMVAHGEEKKMKPYVKVLKKATEVPLSVEATADVLMQAQK